jgi:hypothetical protein
MKPGTLVVCINENFPCIISQDKNKIGSVRDFQPWLNGIFEVDDVLGEFITIEMFNNPEEVSWWISSHFRKLTGDEVIEYQKKCDKYKPMAKKFIKMAKDKVYQ